VTRDRRQQAQRLADTRRADLDERELAEVAGGGGSLWTGRTGPTGP